MGRKRSWMSSDDEATAGAIRGLLRKMPAGARDAVLADVRRNADPAARAEIEDIILVDELTKDR
jgi:hypothetical protein